VRTCLATLARAIAHSLTRRNVSNAVLTKAGMHSARAPREPRFGWRCRIGRPAMIHVAERPGSPASRGASGDSAERRTRGDVVGWWCRSVKSAPAPSDWPSAEAGDAAALRSEEPFGLARPNARPLRRTSALRMRALGLAAPQTIGCHQRQFALQWVVPLLPRGRSQVQFAATATSNKGWSP
jgi:hypothetical protein